MEIVASHVPWFVEPFFLKPIVYNKNIAKPLNAIWLAKTNELQTFEVVTRQNHSQCLKVGIS